jgi:hypothetical protein
MATEISQIPQASTLQQQLDILNSAIGSLNAGLPVTNLTVKQDMNNPPPAGSAVPMGFVRVELNPPISDATTLSNLSVQLQNQADGITQQLVDLGYSPPPPPAWKQQS